MAEANPSLVGSKIWNWDASQMGANGGAHQNLGVSSVGKSGNGIFIQLGGEWQGVGSLHLGHGKSSHEDDLTVPGGLKNLSWRKLRDVDLLVRVSNVSCSCDHLVVDDRDDGLDTNDV
jgi:hypothetical protein